MRIYFLNQNELDSMERKIQGGNAIKVKLVDAGDIDIDAPLMLAYDIDANLPS